MTFFDNLLHCIRQYLIEDFYGWYPNVPTKPHNHRQGFLEVTGSRECDAEIKCVMPGFRVPHSGHEHYLFKDGLSEWNVKKRKRAAVITHLLFATSYLPYFVMDCLSSATSFCHGPCLGASQL